MSQSMEHFGYIPEAQYGEAILQKEPIRVSDSLNAFYYEIEYYNNSDRPVRIAFRDGTSLIMQPRFNPELPRGLIVTRRYRFYPASMTFLPPRVVGPESIAINAYVRTEAKRHAEGRKSGYNIPVEFEFQFLLELSDFDRAAVLYLGRLDLAMSMDINIEVIHPFSELGCMHEQIKGNKMLRMKNYVGFNIECVGTPNMARHVYYNAFGRVYAAPVYTDVSRKPGVYCIHSGECTGEVGPYSPKVDYYTWEEAFKPLKDRDPTDKRPPIRIFSTSTEAEYTEKEELRLAELQYEEKLKELDYTLKERDKELKLLQAQLNERAAVRDEERKLLEHGIKIREMERKEQHEIVKYIPTIIGAVLAIGAFFIKQSK